MESSLSTPLAVLVLVADPDPRTDSDLGVSFVRPFEADSPGRNATLPPFDLATRMTENFQTPCAAINIANQETHLCWEDCAASEKLMWAKV